jgi:hypothetical protein
MQALHIPYGDIMKMPSSRRIRFANKEAERLEKQNARLKRK